MPDSARRFPFLAVTGSARPTDLMPFLPVTLERGGKSIEALGLVDSGASVSVLPYTIGLDLGAVWEEQTTFFKLGGNMANYEAKGLLLTARVAGSPAVNLAFGWTKAENVPLILGQTNFFMEFDVCFFRSQNEFEVKAR